MPANSASRASWMPRAPLIVAFLAGIVVGPMLTSYVGLTVTSRTAGAALHDGTLELRASLCAAQALAANAGADVAKMDDTRRREIATKFAQTQSSGEVDYEIVNLCTNKLGA